MKITAHCLVKNEENFIWYAVNSIIDYVDEIMVWDQGSTDNTASIIKEIKNSKIKYKKQLGDVSEVRQKMLEETNADWVFILDGDEIWWEESIKLLRKEIERTECDVVVVPNYMLIGDVYHYQEEKAGRYKIAGKEGHYNIRAFRKTKGIHVEGVYPNEAYLNKDGIKLQDFSKEKILFLDNPYLHASFLKRSSKDSKKMKYEIGEELPKNFYYPEIFFRPKPRMVYEPWKKKDIFYKLNAFWQTPLKKIKRRII